jgi:hypothetical protein
MKRYIKSLVQRLRKKNLWNLTIGLTLFSILAVYTFAVIIWRDLPDMNIQELLLRIGPLDLIGAFAIYTIALLVAIGAWIVIHGTLSGYWNTYQHVRIYCLTTVTRRLPGTFWYVLGRIVMYEYYGVRRSITAIAGGIEFAATVLGGLLVAVVTWPLLMSTQMLDPIWLFLPLLIGGAILNPPVVRVLVRRLSPGQDISHIRYRFILGAILLLAAVWIIGGLLLFVLTNAIHPLPLSMLPGVIGAWSIAGVAATTIFSFLPFGLGATEITLATVLSPFLPIGEALIVALLMRALLTICELLYGLIALGLSVPLLKHIVDQANTTDTTPPEAGNYEPEPVLPQK